MLGTDLVAMAPEEVAVIGKTRAQLDITQAAVVERALDEVKPDVVMNCAAYTRVDDAERERDAAFAVNAEAVRTLAHLATHVVHFSTDYVFRGDASRPYREDDPRVPLGVYGESKLAGERVLAESGARYTIIRTSWLFGLNGRSFPRTMWERAKAGKPTRVVNDQTGRPAFTRDLAEAVWGLVGHCELPTVHIANAGTATWYDVARRVFEAAGAPELLTPCTTAEYPTPARRPRWSVLDTSRYEDIAGGPLPRWEDALDRFLSEIREEG